MLKVYSILSLDCSFPFLFFW